MQFFELNVSSEVFSLPKNPCSLQICLQFHETKCSYTGIKNSNLVLNSNPKYQILAQNSKNKILKSISFTQSAILLNWMVDVKSELEEDIGDGEAKAPSKIRLKSLTAKPLATAALEPTLL